MHLSLVISKKKVLPLMGLKQVGV